MGNEPTKPLRMGAVHSVTCLRMDDEPRLPVRIRTEDSVTLW